MHYSGVGCAVDKAYARRLYALAADAGDADALNALGTPHFMVHHRWHEELTDNWQDSCARRAREEIWT